MISTFTNIEEIPQILHLPKIVLIYENRPHRFRSFPIPIVILRFDGSFSFDDEPDLKYRHYADSKHHHRGKSPENEHEASRGIIRPVCAEVERAEERFPAPDDDASAGEGEIAEEEEEVSFVVESDALIQPRAMMIEAEDTPFTDATMMCSLWFDRLKSISARQTFLTRPRVPPLDYTAIPLDTRIRFPFIPPPPRPRLRRSLLPCRRDLPNSLRSPIGVLELSIVLSSESESFQRSDTQRLGYELDPIPSYRCDGGTRRIRRRARANGNGHIIMEAKCVDEIDAPNGPA